MGVPYAPWYANGHISATSDPIHFMFCSTVGFSGSADQMALFRVISNPRWKILNGRISAKSHAIHFMLRFYGRGFRAPISWWSLFAMTGSWKLHVGSVYECPLSRSCIYWVERVGGRSWCRQCVGLVTLVNKVWLAFSASCLKVKSCWLKPKRKERLRNASFLPSCSLETKLLQAGAACALRIIITDWTKKPSWRCQTRAT